MSMKQKGLFDEDFRMEKISKLGDPLEKLNLVVRWGIFRPIIENGLKHEAKGPGGRPPYDYIMMFKILILQRLYNISDAQLEYQINDRMSFMKFLGLSLSDTVPDGTTIWFFREQLVKAGVMKKLFNRFLRELGYHDIITREGSIVDATFVDAPKQRNSKKENDEIKKGKTPDEWKEPDAEHKLRQKDVDARWAKKNNETHYGYKDHVKADKDSKIIVDYTVTDASVHDSQELANLVNRKKDKSLYADSAYKGLEIEKCLGKKVKNNINEKGYRNRPLTAAQKKRNKKKSKVRARVEHIFGLMTKSLRGITIRSIGIERASFNIGLLNLTYNLCRYRYLVVG
jgi:transposase, IS5 family